MKAVDYEGKYHEVSPSEIQWKIHTYGVIIEDGKILLSPQYDGYDLPGGKMELGEHIEEAIIREVKEETGLDIRPVTLIDVQDILFKVTFREPQEVWHSVMLYYLCEKIGGTISTAGFDEHERLYAKAAEWIDLQDLETIHPAASYDWRRVVERVTK